MALAGTAEDDCRRIAAFMLANASATPEAWPAPFAAVLNDDDANLFFNYAMPRPGQVFTPADVASLVEAFRHRERTPRLEFLPEASPGLEPLLKAAGFVEERRAPLMTCRRAAAPPAPQGASVQLVAARADLREAGRIQSAAFGNPEPDGERTVGSLERLIAAGGAVALARVNGAPAGAGSLSRAGGGCAEVAGIGVLPAFRRRGLAAVITARLARAGLANGRPMVFLQAAGEDEARLYQRSGFERVGAILHISLT